MRAIYKHLIIIYIIGASFSNDPADRRGTLRFAEHDLTVLN